jgi:hypothetical protein
MDVSEEHVASIFRVEEKAKQETRVKQVARRGLCLQPTSHWFPPKRRLTFNRIHGVIAQKTELFKLKHFLLCNRHKYRVTDKAFSSTVEEVIMRCVVRVSAYEFRAMVGLLFIVRN